MSDKRRCGAIAGRFCSGEMSEDDCLECMDFVNTCDECLSPGSNEANGWYEGQNFQTLCAACYDKLKDQPHD